MADLAGKGRKIPINYNFSVSSEHWPLILGSLHPELNYTLVKLHSVQQQQGKKPSTASNAFCKKTSAVLEKSGYGEETRTPEINSWEMHLLAFQPKMMKWEHTKHTFGVFWVFFGFGVTFIDSINDYIDPINNLWTLSMCVMSDGNVGVV